MLLNLVFKNKYKLMAIIAGMYLAADVAMHKGLTRLLFHKTFPAYKIYNGQPQNKNVLINKNKEWIKAVNTKELLGHVGHDAGGIECDVYFNSQKNVFEVHHDPDKATGVELGNLLEQHSAMGLQSAIWLDLKNLDDSNCLRAVAALTELKNKYRLANKLMVESGRAELLAAFADSGFYTSYYVPVFNPYLISNTEMTTWVDSLSAVLSRSRVSALSGYYFQYSFLNHYFPTYPVLTWAASDRFSLVNWLFKRKIAALPEVFIVLYPH